MDEDQDYQQLNRLLDETMELLQDLVPKLGFNEKQYYYRLRQHYKQRRALSSSMRRALNEIRTQ